MIVFGAIADDLTGATDLASVLRRAGLRVIQTFGVPSGHLPEADAVVVSLKTRNVPPGEATEAACAAAGFLTSAGAKRLYFKYCSTFDSTDRGNIGPVTEALLDHVGGSFTIACPSYPPLGRTVYLGHLFVNGRLLSESPMRLHPLTPMTDSNLVRVLGRQCKGPVGLVDFTAVDAGEAATRAAFEQLAADGHRTAIVDAISDRHVDTIGRAAADLPLVTGGAALGAALVSADFSEQAAAAKPMTALKPSAPVALLSGSCSAMTQTQVQRAVGSAPSYALDPLRLSADQQELPRLLEWARRQAREGSLLIYSTAAAEDIAKAHEGLGREAAASLIEGAFQQVAVVLAESGVRTFVVAGGETSGAVVQALGIRTLGFADEIEPGVPWTYSLDPEGYWLALKSGNFGSPDFFAKALGRAA